MPETQKYVVYIIIGTCDKLVYTSMKKYVSALPC